MKNPWDIDTGLIRCLFFYKFMPTPQEDAVAIVSPGDLASQIVAEDDAAYDAAVAQSTGSKQDESSTSQSSDESEDTGKVDDSSDDKPSDESTPPEGEAKETKPKSDEQDAPLKIGDRVFATPADALKEATRIMGRNAQLAGELDTTRERAETLSSEVSNYKTQLAKALETNQQWAAWYQKEKAGEAATPPDTSQNIEEVVSKVIQAQKAREQEEATLAQMKDEFSKVEAAPNYAGDVQRLVYQLSDKVNPITARYFTPLEAYDFACKHLGVENVLNKPEVVAPKPVPKSPVNSTIAKAAARSVTPPSGRGASKPTVKHDDEDDYIDRSLSAGSLLPF